MGKLMGKGLLTLVTIFTLSACVGIEVSPTTDPAQGDDPPSEIDPFKPLAGTCSFAPTTDAIS